MTPSDVIAIGGLAVAAIGILAGIVAAREARKWEAERRREDAEARYRHRGEDVARDLLEEFDQAAEPFRYRYETDGEKRRRAVVPIDRGAVERSYRAIRRLSAELTDALTRDRIRQVADCVLEARSAAQFIDVGERRIANVALEEGRRCIEAYLRREPMPVAPRLQKLVDALAEAQAEDDEAWQAENGPDPLGEPSPAP